MSESLGSADESVVIAVPVDEANTPSTLGGLPQPGLPLSIALAFVPQVLQFFVVLAVVMVVGFIFLVVTQRPEQLGEYLEQNQILLLPLGTFTTLVAAVAVAKILYPRDTARAVGLRGFSVWQGIGMTLFLLPLAVLASEVTNVIAEVMSWFEPDWMTAFRKASTENFLQLSDHAVLVFFGGCVLPGVGEEILCRGVIGRGLVARYGAVIGVLLSSFLFGIMHIEPVQSAGALTLGLGLHFVFLATRSLVAPILVHAANNALAFSLMRTRETLPLPGLSTSPDESAHTPWIVLCAAVVSLAASTYFLYRIRTRWKMENGDFWSPGYVSGERPPAAMQASAEHARPSWLQILFTAGTFGLFIAAMVAAYR